MKKIEVRRSKIHGSGIFASKKILKGEKVDSIEGELVVKKITSPEESKKFADWIGVGINKWINTDASVFRFINHACEPTTAITSARTVRALRDIEKGEEITMDYSLTDADPFWKIDCTCGSPKCRGEIRSIQTLPKAVILERLPYITNNFQRAYLKHYISNESNGFSGVA